MAFGAYDQTRPWAKAIKQAVLLGKMPPWYADAPQGRFHNDPRLSQPEIDKLVAWADNGAPAGNPKDAPRPVTFQDGWTIDKPDAIFSVPTPFQSPATGTLEYTYVIVPTGFTKDRWITQVEVRPGNRAVVHHANVYSVSLGPTGCANIQWANCSCRGTWGARRNRRLQQRGRQRARTSDRGFFSWPPRQTSAGRLRHADSDRL